MKYLILALLSAAYLVVSGPAYATTTNTAAQVQAAIQDRISDLDAEIKVIKTTLYSTTSDRQRRILRHKIRALRLRVEQLNSTKRLVPRLSKYQLQCLIHYLKLNVSPTNPYS